MTETPATDRPGDSPPPKDGFVARDRRSPLTDPWEPIYERAGRESVSIGLWLRDAHCNARGIVHGGLISALADNAMGHSCIAALKTLGARNVEAGGSQAGPKISGLVTVNLAIDFLGTARPGAWLRIDCDVGKIGRTLCFASCTVSADGEPCARGTATFKVL